MVHESIKEFIRTKPDGIKHANIISSVLSIGVCIGMAVYIVVLMARAQKTTIEKISDLLTLGNIIIIVIPPIILVWICRIFVKLNNGTSKLCKFTRLGDPRYKEYLSIADTNRLINIIENNYKHCSEFKSSGSNEKNGENSTSAEHSQDEDREFEALFEEESESLEPFYQLERERRKEGELQKALKILRKGFPEKDVTREQRKRYQSFYKQLEKIVVIPNRKSEKDVIMTAITMTISVVALIVNADVINWSVGVLVFVVVLSCLVISLLTEFFKWIDTRQPIEEDTLYMYRLLEDVVIFQIPIYDVDKKFIDDYWEALKYFDWICSKIGYIEVFQKLGVSKPLKK